MKTNFNNFRKEARKLLFEDTYPEYSYSSWADGDRAGTQWADDGPEEDDPLDMPINPQPQMATQLSEDEPPVDDPEYAPVNNQELARSLYTLAQRLPDDTGVVEKTYEKFKKFVDDHERIGVEVVDQGGMNEPEEVREVRALIRNQLLMSFLTENWDDFKLGVHDDEDEESEYDDPSDDDLRAIEKGDPHTGEWQRGEEATLEDIAQDMGISVSGAKKMESEALKKFRLSHDAFPGDIDKLKGVALKFMMDTMLDLDLIDPEDAAAFNSEYGSNPNVNAWPALRTFMWDTFLNNVYKKMLRDAAKQGVAEADLGQMQPGLYDRAVEYFDGLPHGKKVQGVITALASDEQTMMLNSLMKDYLREKEASSSSELELFGLVRESVDVPLAPEKSEWMIVPDPERLMRKFVFEDIEGRNWFLKELLDDETRSGHNGKIIVDGMDTVIEVWTHDIDAVTELDLEYAARCDDIFNDVALLGELGYEHR